MTSNIEMALCKNTLMSFSVISDYSPPLSHMRQWILNNDECGRQETPLSSAAPANVSRTFSITPVLSIADSSFSVILSRTIPIKYKQCDASHFTSYNIFSVQFRADPDNTTTHSPFTHNPHIEQQFYCNPLPQHSSVIVILKWDSCARSLQQNNAESEVYFSECWPVLSRRLEEQLPLHTNTQFGPNSHHNG